MVEAVHSASLSHIILARIVGYGSLHVFYRPPVCVNQESKKSEAYALDAAPNLQYLKEKFPFESSIFMIYSLRLLHLLIV